MAISAKLMSISAAFHRWWWRLSMSEKFSSGTKKPKETNKQKNGVSSGRNKNRQENGLYFGLNTSSRETLRQKRHC